MINVVLLITELNWVLGLCVCLFSFSVACVPYIRFESSRRVRALDFLVQTCIRPHESMPEGDIGLVETLFAGCCDLKKKTKDIYSNCLFTLARVVLMSRQRDVTQRCVT